MKKGIRAGRSYKEQYSAYKSKNTYVKNRGRDLVRHVLKNQNDKQAEIALAKSDKVPFPYRRQKPRHKGINTGLALVDKRTKKVVERVKVEEPWLVNMPRHVKTIPEQMLDIGLISSIPKRFTNHGKGKHKSRRASNTASPKS